jgi:hypothetical protein
VRFTIVPESSGLLIAGRSSLHAIHADAKGLTGYLDVTTNGSTLVTDPPPGMRIEVPLERISSGNDLQDSEMRRLVGGQRYPRIIAELSRLEPLPTPNQFKGEGSVTINGTTKNCAGTITIIVNGDSVMMQGASTIDIRNWGIQPPRILMFSVLPQFDIQLQAVAKQEGQASTAAR